MSRRAATLTTVAALALGGLLVPAVVGTTPAAADTVSNPPPVVARAPGTVTADALPTVQIDGVVWAQAVVGNTVYAAGSFANARPAGAAPGTNQTPRANLLSYNLSTGVLNTSFAPSLNAQALAVTASPDGSRIYVGGQFTTANGVMHNRIAAYSTSTGALINSFSPNLDASVYTIVATNSTVYVGGIFSKANGVTRTRLAAFSAADGSLLAWAPTADNQVKAMTLTPDGSRLIVGGMFLNLNGSVAYGLGALDATTGALLPWAATNLIHEGGSGSSISDLYTDGTNVYGTGWAYGSNISTLEGGFSADPNTGNLNWIENCWGDVYQTFAVNNTVYNVGHNHGCTAMGGFPDTNPRNFHRSMALTMQPNGTLGHDIGNPDSHSTDFYGQPGPSIMDWWPDLDIGTVTGQDQGPWSVRGNSQYVVEGGEFQHVNGTAQQGLVRFAVSSIAPNKQGPQVLSANMTPKLVARSGSSVRVAWSTDWDRDDKTLTYTLLRNGKAVYTTQADGQFWQLTPMGTIDTGLAPGTTYTYQVKVNDPSGNTTWSGTASITTPTSNVPDSAYVQDVLNAGATHYWRLAEPAGGTTDYDYAGFEDLSLNAGVAGGAPGAFSSDPNTASTFTGSQSGLGVDPSLTPGPNTFSISAWFSTTSTGGGKIVGFGNASSGLSSNYDRHIYLDSQNHVVFGVYNNAGYTITSPKTYNDGQYHQVVGTLSSTGMALYIDGKLIGTNAGTTVGQPYSGYWRIGGDSAWSGNNYFTGQVDDVAIFPTALTIAQVRQQYTDSGRTLVGGTAPSDAYGAKVWNDSPSTYYRLDETACCTATDLSGNSNDGTYSGGVTFGVSSPVTGSGSAVTFNGTDGTLASSGQMSGPSVYSEEAWFKTTSTSGGKLIGFGDARTGTSSNYDRHVYMLPSGQLVFGTYTGQLNLATSSRSYNDGGWHHVVATQGPDGMTLYVDGQVVGTNPQTSAQGYNGYWRVGGDNLNGWGAGNNYFAGTIDEAAVYLSELTLTQVRAHYFASPAAVDAPPSAAFTSSTSAATASFDATGSSDPDGTVANYAWDFGDSTSGTGALPTHTYTASGTYHVTLTVTDDRGASTSVTHDVTVTVPANQPPTASFTATPTNLSVAFDGSASSDPDGSVVGYSWDFGDGSAGASAVTPSHTYANAGTYHVTLTVTDNGGAQNSTTQDVTVTLPPNQPPTASFTSKVSQLAATFDGSGSSDPDGTVVSYAWDYGDNSPAGSGVTSQHLYAAPGTYTVTLTVTDNRGGTGTTVHTVTVTAVVASDAFSRTVASGWGTADQGGAWSVTGTSNRFAVGNGVGTVTAEAAGVCPTSYLNAVSQLNVNAVIDASVSKSSGNGSYVELIARHSGTSDYRLKVLYRADGTVQAILSRVVSGTDTALKTLVVPSLTYTAGVPLRIRFVVSGNGTTTVSGTIWPVTGTEPASPQISATDSTASLQAAGSFGLQSYVAGNATAVPVVFTYDNLSVATS
ncbi:MAG: PKD domain-containing protein [Jatrophihabitans sp.]|uniref:PKD domain-containing protein n=1 Tax=Jatrophihabitans sp. TaxID=1932789 RepID=UPI003F7FC216